MNSNGNLGPVLGLLGIVLSIAAGLLGGRSKPDTKALLYIGLGCIAFGILIGNGLLSD